MAYKLGLIGTGRIAEKHLAVIKKIKELEVVAASSRTKKKLKKFAKKFKIKKTYSDIDKMLKTEKLDGLIILVSVLNVFSVLKKVIKYKIPFFVEKPATLNILQANEINLLIKKHKTKNVVGLNRRYYSIFLQAKQFIKKNGNAKAILIEGHEKYNFLKKIINKKILNNWLVANSVHNLDLFQYFFGKIKTIKNISASMKFKNKKVGTYLSNWDSPGRWSVKIFGSGYTIIFDPLEKGKIIFSNLKEKIIRPSKQDLKFKPGFYLQMKYFLKFIKSGKKMEPQQDIQDWTNTLKILSKIDKK